MSSRLYPVFKQGSQQLRILLPNFWMKLIKPNHNLLANQLQFICSPEMTRNDIKQYLEKIYNVPVIHVSTHIQMGKTKTKPNRYITKEDDVKYAYVTLPKDEKFDFPDLFSKLDDLMEKEKKSMDEAKALHAQKTKFNVAKQGVPSWFSF